MNRTRPTILFVLGSGRSGTTLVLNILSRLDGLIAVPRLAGRVPQLSTPAGMLARWRIGPEVWIKPSGESTALFREAGIAQTLHGRLHRVMGSSDVSAKSAAKLRSRLETIRRAGRASVVVLKSTAATGRVPLLAAHFPDAAFLHVIRDPREVVLSLLRQRFWQDMTLWWDGRTTTQYARDEQMAEERVAALHWARQVRAAQEGLAALPQHRASTVRYADVVANPVGTLGDAMSVFHIPLISREAWQQRLLDLDIRPRSSTLPVPAPVEDAVRQHAGCVASQLGFLSR